MTKHEAKLIAKAIESVRTGMTRDQHECVIREIGRTINERVTDFNRDTFEAQCRGERA